MGNVLKKNMQDFILQDLDYDLFWSIKFSKNKIEITGWYSEKTEKYLLEKMFITENNTYFPEFYKDNIMVTLIKK